MIHTKSVQAHTGFNQLFHQVFVANKELLHGVISLSPPLPGGCGWGQSLSRRWWFFLCKARRYWNRWGQWLAVPGAILFWQTAYIAKQAACSCHSSQVQPAQGFWLPSGQLWHCSTGSGWPAWQQRVWIKPVAVAVWTCQATPEWSVSRGHCWPEGCSSAWAEPARSWDSPALQGWLGLMGSEVWLWPKYVPVRTASVKCVYLYVLVYTMLGWKKWCWKELNALHYSLYQCTWVMYTAKLHQ
jgi:hypothetical protein